VSTKTIEVKYLARVEGEGGLRIRIENKKIEELELRIFEPPRFFEGFLRGRAFFEVPDITSRICGICPVAYQTSAINALEVICGVVADEPTRKLRRLLYLGEWIESHTLHMYMLHAPDFLGYPSGIHMAKDYPNEVKAGLELKKIGNELMTLVGGREIHPINMRVGGFYRYPTAKELKAFLPRLEKAKEIAVATIRLVASFPFPDFEQDYEYVCLRSEHGEYPVESGRIISNRGLDIGVEEYEDHFEEIHVRHSTALHATHKGHGTYHVGPLARLALNFDRLSPLALSEAEKLGLDPSNKNPFRSIVARAVEVLYACEESIRLIESYTPPAYEGKDVKVTPKAGVGTGISEAPRGILYHRYRLNDDGTVADAKITPPTSQNQSRIEQDLHALVNDRITWSKPKLTHLCEMAIRNYDPCISCSTHFLKVTWEGEAPPETEQES